MLAKLIKISILVCFVALIVIMAMATFFEQSIADNLFYHSIWFCVLWIVLAMCSLFVFIKQLRNKLPVLIFHLSMLIILMGAFCTKILSKQGVLHLRNGEGADYFVQLENFAKINLDFTVRLDSFMIKYYEPTQMPQDYLSFITVYSQNDSVKAEVSMNNIFKKNGYRFYQSSYDTDGLGTFFSVNYDPYGISITYIGYIIFAISGLWILFSNRSYFKKLLNHQILKKGGLFILCFLFVLNGEAQTKKIPTISFDESAKLSEKPIVYNGRIAPFNTMARDFLNKIYGSAAYHNLTAEQVVCGLIYRIDVWKNEPIIFVKDKNIAKQLGIEQYASFADFFDKDENYLLNTLEPTKAVREVDEKIGLIIMLTQGKLFDETDVKISNAKIKAEIIYNRINFAKILFMVNLTIGFLAFVVMVLVKKFPTKLLQTMRILLLFSFIFNLCGYILRWYISERVPMSNGYETMLFMSLVIMLLALLFSSKLKVLIPFGYLISGFTLLVAWLAQRNPQITPLMPVLNSPLLSAHVTTVMIAYSLLAFTFFSGLFSFFVKDAEKLSQLSVLSRIMLYPAEILLGIGIFLGAVWANISWGRYWSWDPKETWALITFMIYALPFHKSAFKFFNTDTKILIYFVVAFLTVLMTYFGVNYFLGGMHSYANNY